MIPRQLQLRSTCDARQITSAAKHRDQAASDLRERLSRRRGMLRAVSVKFSAPARLRAAVCRSSRALWFHRFRG